MRTHNLRPQISIAASEHPQLLALAAGGGGSLSQAAESLLMEVERAKVVPDKKLPADIVRMHSRVQYRQSMTWETRDGRKNVLTVLSVTQNADEAAEA